MSFSSPLGPRLWRRPSAVTALVATGAGVSAIGLGLLVPTVGDLVFSSSQAGVVAGVVLVGAAASPLLARLRCDRLDAAGLYGLATATFLGLTSLAWVGEPTRPGPGLDQEAIAGALRLVAAGLLAFWLGSRLLGPARPPPPIVMRPADRPSVAALVAIYSVSLLAVLATFALGAYGYISDPDARASTLPFAAGLSLLATLGDLVLVVTIISYLRTRDGRLLPLLVGLILIQMAVGFVGGNKTITMLPLAFLLAGWIAAKQRLPVAAIAGAAALLLFVIVPVNQDYRAAVRGEQQAPEEALIAALVQLDPVRAVGNAGDYVLTRFRSIDSVALIQMQTPSPFPYAGGEKYILLPLIITVPRLVWPDKPELTDAGLFTYTYWQAPIKIRSSTQLTQIGDLYRNFGSLGVVIGLFLVGIVVAGLTVMHRRLASPRSELVYLFAIVTVVSYVEADLPLLVATATRELALAAGVAWLLLPGRSGPPGYRRLIGGRRGDASTPTAQSA